MVLQHLQIYFDNPTATYYGGQIVTGKLVVRIDAPKRIRGIELTFRGAANVQWSESETERDAEGHNRQVSTTYSANELYFENKFYILGGPNSEMLLQPGDHMYSFSMQLPSILPSSFEGRYGQVRYTLRATMIRPWKFNHNSKAAFTVLSHLDLNTNLALQEPRQIVNEKYLCCCCCKSGPISVIISLPATGFTPGQEMPFTLEVDNNTDENIPNVKCTLQKLVTCTVVRPSRKTREDKVVAAQMQLGSVKPNDSHTWMERMRIPSLPPSFLHHCTIIDIHYSLEVEVQISGMHKNLLVSVPLTLGTIPIMSYISNPQIQPGLGSALQPLLAPLNPTAPQMEIPPPSYEECSFGPTNITDHEDNQYTYGNMGFTPRYPMYNFNR